MNSRGCKEESSVIIEEDDSEVEGDIFL